MLRSSQPSRQASLRIAASWPRRSSRPRGEKIVFDALLHHLAAVLDPPLRHGHVADGREDVGVEARLALLHRPGLLAALDAVSDVLLAEHADGAGGADVGPAGPPARCPARPRPGRRSCGPRPRSWRAAAPASTARPRRPVPGTSPDTSCRRAPAHRAAPATGACCRRGCGACPARAGWASCEVASASPPRLEAWRRVATRPQIASCITLVYHLDENDTRATRQES